MEMVPSATRTPARPAAWIPLALALAVAAGFANGLPGVLLFDDEINIVENASIRQLSDWRAVLFPPPQVLTAGRPLLNLSFALNYAAGGITPRGYHAVNIAIHVAAALALFGAVRRALARSGFAKDTGLRADAIAALAAAVWALHPLQTSSVTYISQRAESLMGLAYFLTFYAFVRAVERPRSWWGGAAVLCCAGGMLAKETMVTAPLLVLLFDRACCAGSFREIWRQRGRLHLALAGTWILLAVLMVATSVRQRGIGFEHGYTWSTYLRVECSAVVHYLRLALWPWPLVFDYGAQVRPAALPLLAFNAALLAALAAAILLAWRRRAPLAFLGTWFFVVLAPTSSVVPVAGQPIAENRVYVPLAAIAVALALACGRLFGPRAYVPMLLIAAASALGTAARNRTYHDAIAIWAETAAHRPDSSRAHFYHGSALLRAGQMDEGIRELQAAVRIRARYIPALTNLGVALSLQKRFAEAIPIYEEALLLRPDDAALHRNYGEALLRVGRRPEALDHFERTLRLDPADDQARFNRAMALRQLGRNAEALVAFSELQLAMPGNAEVKEQLAELRALREKAEPP